MRFGNSQLISLNFFLQNAFKTAVEQSPGDGELWDTVQFFSLQQFAISNGLMYNMQFAL